MILTGISSSRVGEICALAHVRRGLVYRSVEMVNESLGEPRFNMISIQSGAVSLDSCAVAPGSALGLRARCLTFVAADRALLTARSARSITSPAAERER